MATASAERSRFRHGVEGGVGNAPARFPVASFSAAAAVPRRMGEPNPPPPSPPSPPNPPNPSEAFAPSDAWLPPRLDARPPNEKLAAQRWFRAANLHFAEGAHSSAVEAFTQCANYGDSCPCSAHFMIGHSHALTGELEAALPEVLRPHSLLMFWGFKHDTVRTRAYHGIKPHADTAAVNLNFCTSAATRTPVFPWSFHPHSDRPAFASVRRQG